MVLCSCRGSLIFELIFLNTFSWSLEEKVGFLKKELNPLSDFKISSNLTTCFSTSLVFFSSSHKENKARAYLAEGFEFISLISCKQITLIFESGKLVVEKQLQSLNNRAYQLWQVVACGFYVFFYIFLFKDLDIEETGTSTGIKYRLALEDFTFLTA